MANYSAPPPSGQDVAGSVFFKKFLSSAEGYLRQPNRLKPLLAEAYQKAANKNELGHLAQEVWHAMQGMFRLVRTSVSGEYQGVPGTTIAAAVAVLIYFLSPIDLIPDFIPVLGMLDDVALLAWFSTSIKHELDKFYEWEAAKAATVANPTQFAAAAALPSAPAGSGQSATDAGLGSPSSSTTTPVHDAGPDGPLPEPQPQPDDLAQTSDGSRDGNRQPAIDSGGNNR